MIRLKFGFIESSGIVKFFGKLLSDDLLFEMVGKVGGPLRLFYPHPRPSWYHPPYPLLTSKRVAGIEILTN